MRYQPNTLKSCFLMYPIRNLMTRTDTANATTVPIPSTSSSSPVNEKPNFRILIGAQAEHDRHRKEERKFRRCNARYPDQQGADDGRAERDVPGMMDNT